MAAGSHVFRANRLGLWVIPNANLKDKLNHILPRVRVPLPNLTDIYLPPEATKEHRDICRANGFFVNTYDVVHERAPGALADEMLAKRNFLRTGAIEIDLEGAAVQPDIPSLSNWARAFMARVRQSNPNLPVRFNVPPFKGYALPIDLIVADPQLFVIAQAYYGNMDGRLSEADVLLDLLNWGVPQDKVKIHYAVMANSPRTLVLPGASYKPLTEGSVYDDDLLMDAGLIN